ncbi:TIM-barrel domain-containing protein [Streptococcus pluranimalium]|uniref:TIM-barrel domain-containing protein n=1 Tax=Streptococcus pluranimalium TaxID=82348 RepID=UPI003F691AF5
MYTYELVENKLNIFTNSEKIEISELGKNIFKIYITKDNIQRDSSEYSNFHRLIDGELIVVEENGSLFIKNNDLSVVWDGYKLTYYNSGKKILQEFSRVQANVRRTKDVDDDIPIESIRTSSLNIQPYEFKTMGDLFEIDLLFEAKQDEKIYGMGGYQNEFLDKNGQFLELKQRNSQTTIPTYISNYNYGFIWNNSSIGYANFSKETYRWHSNRSNFIEYVVFADSSIKKLLKTQNILLGLPPTIDKNLLGLWQSKLRYQTTQEVREVYNEYQDRGINLSVLVIDYFHWTEEGNFEFDELYWSGISDFAKEILPNKSHLMVSIWPTVSEKSKYFDNYLQKNMLLSSKYEKSKVFNDRYILDFSKKNTREFVGELIKYNYFTKCIQLFWTDQAEPEMNYYDHSEYRMNGINMMRNGNKFPIYYNSMIYNEVNNKFPILSRSTWLGGNKLGVLVWSGDIESSFRSLRRQIQIALSMSMSGQSWWTSDIGGFHSGYSNTEYFKELLIRWFQFAVFTPILRMHGDRQPHLKKIGNSGGGIRTSGSPNEIWSFGSKVENILLKYLKIRENITPYLLKCFDELHEFGIPIMRPMFVEFPDERSSWKESSQYMLGSDIVVSPITYYKQEYVDIFLPSETWIDVNNKKEYKGGRYRIKANIDTIPIFIRKSTFINMKKEGITWD